MRLTKVTFNGFKRLANATCNVDGRLIAFLGPNEAGKSSVLEALAWLSDTDSGPLELSLRSRAMGDLTSKHVVVTAQFALDNEDRDALADLDTDVSPRYYLLHKTADGTYQARTEPPITRRRGALDEAIEALAVIEAKYGESLERNRQGTGVRDRLDVVTAALGNEDAALDATDDDAFEKLATWLRIPENSVSEDVADDQTDRRAAPEDEAAANLLDVARSKLKEPDVVAESRRRLQERKPDFLLFEDNDRVLTSTYDLSSPALHAEVPPALANLLRLADTTVASIRTVQKTGDITRIRSMLKRLNQLLRLRLEPTWGQSQITVQLEVDGDLLQILVDEVDPDGATTDIAERSDGLRTFIALVCFLADREKDASVPPVLMIDEAETHLHYDAQADFLDVLLNHVQTSKVIYTTHSPGCLPPDLGTGIRLVAPDPTNRAASLLKADFWSSKQPGFSPLLFAMGAGAAAFSVCRRAVLAEGASDMILLPSLLRAATGLGEVGYQVAPGLATRTSDLADADVASQVVYLADGDEAGRGYMQVLLDEGVDPIRVRTLPQDQAIEDLLDPTAYLIAVHTLMADAGYAGRRVTLDDLDGQGPVAMRLEKWCKLHDYPHPGKTAVASYLVQDRTRIVLAPRRCNRAARLHRDFSAALSR